MPSLTVDTHVRLQARTTADHACPLSEVMDDADLCLYVHRFADALDEIASGLATGPGGADLLYLYGDHAPPYASGALRAAFDANRVPVLVLRRRGSGADRAAMGRRPPGAACENRGRTIAAGACAV